MHSLVQSIHLISIQQTFVIDHQKRNRHILLNQFYNMRFSLFKATMFLGAVSSVVMAQTPPNFQPSTKNDLQVKFGSLDVLPGRVEPQKGKPFLVNRPHIMLQ